MSGLLNGETLSGICCISRMGLSTRGRKRFPFYKKQTRHVLENCGHIDAEHIEEYIAHGGYEAISKSAV